MTVIRSLLGSTSWTHAIRRFRTPPRSIVLTIALLVVVPMSAAWADSDGDWTKLYDPAPRMQYGTVYDPVSDCLLVIGGGDDTYTWYSDVWTIPLGGTADWHALPVSGALPSPRSGCSYVYDSIRHRVIMYGGLIGLGPADVAPPYSYTNEVWVLSLDGVPSWTQLSPAGTPPPTRTRHAAIYDPVRDRMVVMGGQSDIGLMHQDAWSLSLSGIPTWTPLPNAPAAPFSNVAVYDGAHDRMVVLNRSELWALSFAGTPTWTILPHGALAPGTESAAAIYDPDSDRLVAFFWRYGGSEETWSFPFATGEWTLLPPSAGSPGPRGYTPAAYDPVRRQMLMAAGEIDRDVWALPLSPAGPWTRLYDDPLQPAGRPTAEFAAIDPALRRLVVWKADNPGTQEVWSLTLGLTPEWTPLAVTGTPPSLNFSLNLYDSMRNRMVIFGYPRDTWSLPLTGAQVWQPLVPATPQPSNLYWGFWTDPAGIYDPLRDRLLVWGGLNPNCGMESCNPVFYRELWQLNFSGTPTWTKLVQAGPTPPDDAYRAIYDPIGDRMLMLAGTHIWALSLSGAPTWTQLPDGAAVPGPFIYDAVRNRLVAYGGSDHFRLWAQQPPGSGVWIELNDRNPPRRRWEGQVAVYDRVEDRMIIHGGTDMNLTWFVTWGEPNTGAPIGPGPAANGLQLSVTCAPGSNEMVALLALPSRAPARLELFDVSGRKLLRRDLGSLDPGAHRVGWNVEAIPSGLFLVRLTHGLESRTAKLVRAR